MMKNYLIKKERTMEGNIKFILAIILIMGIMSIINLAFVSASASFTNYQYQPSFQTYYSSSQINTYWPILGQDADSCFARQDLLLNIAPGGCQPAVVRSDLLADQNVPVFCQIDALKINPLIEVSEIKNLIFTGEYPSDVQGVGFHPARAALRTRDVLLGSPLLNNIGYVVIILKRNPIEANLSENVSLTLRARIEYDSGNSLGVGTSDLFLKIQSDQEWNSQANRQSFWKGQFYARAVDIDVDAAAIAIYSGEEIVSITNLKEGQKSDEIFLPGYYCRAGLEVELVNILADSDSATIEVTGSSGTEVFDVYKGSSFLEGGCEVRSISLDPNGGGRVSVRW